MSVRAKILFSDLLRQEAFFFFRGQKIFLGLLRTEDLWTKGLLSQEIFDMSSMYLFRSFRVHGLSKGYRGPGDL